MAQYEVLFIFLRSFKVADLPPISIAHTENIFSGLVLADTLPKPTLVKLLHVKYKAVTYAVKVSGGLDLLTGRSIRSPNSYNQPVTNNCKGNQNFITTNNNSSMR